MKCKRNPSGWRARKGTIIKSVWLHECLEDGTIFALNRRVRETVNDKGEIKRTSEQTLVFENIGPKVQAEIDNSKHKIMATSIDYICTVCLTSDHVQKEKHTFPGGYSCTMCDAYHPGTKE